MIAEQHANTCTITNNNNKYYKFIQNWTLQCRKCIILYIQKIEFLWLSSVWFNVLIISIIIKKKQQQIFKHEVYTLLKWHSFSGQ